MTAQSGLKSINALNRGLDVLHAIRESSAVTLTELHRQLGIPNATLLRILKTLREAGWVERIELEMRYVPAAAPGESGPAPQWRARVSALAAPCRVALQRQIPWPTDLAVRDGLTMLILDAYRPSNGLAVNYRVLGFRPHMLISSLGRCYLAFCAEDERRAILSQLKRSTRPLDRLALHANPVRQMVARIRSQGYGTRDPSDASYDSPERFGALSVPVFQGDLLVACLSCAWLPTVVSEQQVVAAYMTHLRTAAQAIGQRLLKADLGPPPG